MRSDAFDHGSEHQGDRHHRREGDTMPPRDGLPCAGQVTGQCTYRDVEGERRGDPPGHDSSSPSRRCAFIGASAIAASTAAPPNTLPVTSITGVFRPSLSQIL
jgi:hypothetical protein